MLILLKWPCLIPRLFKNYRNEFSRFFIGVRVYFRTEKSEMTRLKLDLNQDVLQGSQQNKIHMEARSSISHTGSTTVSVFVAVNNTPKALKSPVPNSQRFYRLVWKCSIRTKHRERVFWVRNPSETKRLLNIQTPENTSSVEVDVRW